MASSSNGATVCIIRPANESVSLRAAARAINVATTASARGTLCFPRTTSSVHDAGALTLNSDVAVKTSVVGPLRVVCVVMGVVQLQELERTLAQKELEAQQKQYEAIINKLTSKIEELTSSSSGMGTLDGGGFGGSVSNGRITPIVESTSPQQSSVVSRLSQSVSQTGHSKMRSPSAEPTAGAGKRLSVDLSGSEFCCVCAESFRSRGVPRLCSPACWVCYQTSAAWLEIRRHKHCKPVT